MGTQIRPALLSLLIFTVMTGFIYPAVITGVAQLIFPRQANGSLIIWDGKALGSELVGQPFDDPRHFWGRLSATGSFPYNAAASAGTNFGPLNPALTQATQARITALKASDPQNAQPIPVDLVTSSGSGLDPHISIASALFQVSRIARIRGISEDSLRSLIMTYTESRQLGILGELRVNVLTLNLALDGIQ